MISSLVSLMQLCDSLFPVGAFSHSDGLESATAGGGVATVADLSKWMDAVRDEALLRLEAPVVLHAWRSFHAQDDEALRFVDDEIYAMRPSASGREAMRAMGARLLKTWQYIRPADRIEHAIAVRPLMTLPAAFGVVCAASGVTERDAVAGYAYTRLAATLSAAMRLMPVGQHEGHRLLAKSLDAIPPMVDALLRDTEGGAAGCPLRSFMPAADIAAMSQQYVPSRLFRS